MFLSIVEKSEIKAQHHVTFPAREDDKVQDAHADLMNSGTHDSLAGALGNMMKNITSLSMIGAPRAQASGKKGKTCVNKQLKYKNVVLKVSR